MLGAMDPAVSPPSREDRTNGGTRTRLLQAAREAFAERGYVATRVDDIVGRAGVSHGSFYLYFGDKRDALLQLTSEVAQSLYGTAIAPLLGSSVESSPRATIRARIAAFLRTQAEHWDVVRTWIQASGMHPEVDEVRRRIRQSIVESMGERLRADDQRGYIAEGVDTQVAATALSDMVEGYAIDRLNEGKDFTAHDIDQLTDMWVRAVYRPEHFR